MLIICDEIRDISFLIYISYFFRVFLVDVLFFSCGVLLSHILLFKHLFYIYTDIPDASSEVKKDWTKKNNKRKFPGMPTQQDWGELLKRQKSFKSAEPYDEDDACTYKICIIYKYIFILCCFSLNYML